MNRRFGQPRLPRGILHTLTEIRAPAPTYDVENGGQWVATQKAPRRPPERRRG